MTPEQIKALRTQLGISQREFAERLNAVAPGRVYSAPTIYRWETGSRSPDPYSRLALERLAAQAGSPGTQGTNTPLPQDAGASPDPRARNRLRKSQ